MLLRVVDGLSVRLLLDRGFGEGDAGDAVERRDFAVDGARDAQRSASDLQRSSSALDFCPKFIANLGLGLPEGRQSSRQTKTHHHGRTRFLDEVVRRGSEQHTVGGSRKPISLVSRPGHVLSRDSRSRSPFEFRQASTSDEHQSRLEVVDHVDQHVPRDFGMDRLAVDPDVEPRAFEEGGRLPRKRERGGLTFALVGDLGLLRDVVRVDCQAERNSQFSETTQKT